MTSSAEPTITADSIDAIEGDEVFDIIQIGYGPVGQTAAALLGGQGHRVAVFERWPTLYGRARAGHVDHEVMRTFQSLGIADAVVQNATLADKYVFRNAAGEMLMSFDYGAPGISGWLSDYIVYQPDIEDALDAAVRDTPNVQVHQGWEAVGLRQDADAVEVELRRVGQQGDGSGVVRDEVRTVRARYLVGADGANSFVRSAVGIGWVDLGFRSIWLVVDLVPTGSMHFEYDNVQVCDPARPHCLFQLGRHHRRFEFAAIPGEDPARLSDPEVAWDLMRRYDVTPANAVLERQAVYTFGSSITERWRAGRVFLTGDAAHLMPPFMGQGMCTGLRDAANLAWRLDMVLNGSADEALLDSYEAERAPQAETLVRMSVAAGEVSCTFDPDVAAARDEAFRSGTMPPPPPMPGLTAGLLAGDDPLAGTLALQGRVRAAGTTARFDDVFGAGWALIAGRPVDAALGPEDRAVLEPPRRPRRGRRRGDGRGRRLPRLLRGSRPGGDPAATRLLRLRQRDRTGRRCRARASSWRRHTGACHPGAPRSCSHAPSTDCAMTPTADSPTADSPTADSPTADSPAPTPPTRLPSNRPGRAKEAELAAPVPLKPIVRTGEVHKIAEKVVIDPDLGVGLATRTGPIGRLPDLRGAR